MTTWTDLGSLDERRQFEMIANSIPQLAWMARGDGHIFWYNQRWFDYTGASPEQMAGWGWQSVHDPEALPRVMEKWQAALAQGEPWEDTFPLRRHDGVLRTHLSRANPFRDAHGQLLFWFGTNTDIEDQLQQQKELEQTRDQLKLSLEAGELGIFHCPMPLGKIIWNDKCKEHFFLPPDAEIDFDLFTALIHPDDRQRVGEAVRAAVEEGAAYDILYRTTGANGSIRWIRAKGRAYFDERNRPLRFDGITLDVSEEVRQSEERQALLLAEQSARLEAERASRMKDEFLATLSHELRTPLSAVLGWSQLLQSLADDNLEVSEGLATIERNALVQQKLVEDLLDVSRIVSGKLLLNMTDVDLVEMLKTVLKSLEASVHSKRLQVSSELNGFQSLVVLGDQARLQQIVWNILSNAIKFTPSGGSVCVSLCVKEPFVEITVSDTGPGVPEDFLPHIFDRFRQSDSSTTRRHGGLGLGLSLAKQLAELHGGAIGASNRSEGKGAVFSVLLPARSADDPRSCDATDVTASPMRAPVDPELVQGLRVVVVDDDDDIRQWLERLLTNFGVEVLPASCAADALSLVREMKPDVLLTDIGMPKEDGYSLIQKIRSLAYDQGRLTPAAALTAFARPEDRAKVLAAGFQAHLTKPVEPSKLVIALATLAGRLKA